MYRHAEAHCLLKYRSKDGRHVEWLYNSRDGVVPFCIPPKDAAGELTLDDFIQHVDFEYDLRVPHYVAGPGERYFADMTLERAREFAIARVDASWTREPYPMSAMFNDKHEAVEHLTEEFFGDGHEPDILDGPMPPRPMQSAVMVPWTPKKFA